MTPEKYSQEIEAVIQLIKKVLNRTKKFDDEFGQTSPIYAMETDRKEEVEFHRIELGNFSDEIGVIAEDALEAAQMAEKIFNDASDGLEEENF